MKDRRPSAAFFLFFSLVFSVLFAGGVRNLSAQAGVPDVFSAEDFPRGDAAMAEKYALWIKNAADEGRWKEALAAACRASDFSGVSSDISYLLALARFHEKKGRGGVLEALELALRVDRWNLFDAETARFLKIETLIALRAHGEALAELAKVGRGAREAALTLKALSFFNRDEFFRYMTETLDRYPRESGPVRVFLKFLADKDEAGKNPQTRERDLLELVVRRLPALLLSDPGLAWMAAPFMRGRDDAKRLVEAYRALHEAAKASLPIALELGAIDEETALAELFAFSGAADEGLSLDVALLDKVFALLRRDEARAAFRRNLSLYSGVITEDADRDGIPETEVRYAGGMPAEAAFDANQDCLADLTVFYEGGDPARALAFIPPEGEGRPASENAAEIRWERYPAVLEAVFDGAKFVPRPLDLFFEPVVFDEIRGSGVFFPRRELLNPALTRRVLVSQSLRVERPSREFAGGTEIVELARGIPVRAREYVGDLMVSETEFLRGRPQLQRVDLDFDGKMDTARFFRRNYRPVESYELWDYDRDIERTVSDWER